MDRISKFLEKLTKKERSIFLKLFADIKSLSLKNHNIKAIKDHKNVYRLRKGHIRIIFAKYKDKGILINIAHRKDVYKKT